MHSFIPLSYLLISFKSAVNDFAISLIHKDRMVTLTPYILIKYWSNVIRLHIFAFLIVMTSISCAQLGNYEYVDQLGDISFQSGLDDSSFDLCDDENVVHSRQSLRQEDGWTGLKYECVDKFNYQPVFQSFTGYVMIRFLINCNYDWGGSEWRQ